MLSCTQCSNSVQSEKAIVENLNQFSMQLSSSLRLCLDDGKRQMEAEALGAGYADREDGGL